MESIDVKDIIVKPINSKIANDFIKRTHYSGKVVQNSQLHFGAFYNNILHGVMSLGPSLDKRKIIGLVKETSWNDFLELNRLAFDDFLPKNSESRCLSVMIKLIRKNYKNIQWIVSFADGTQCGDGTIYRASGFVLTNISISKNLARLPSGETIHKMTLEAHPTQQRKELGGKSYYDITGGKYNFTQYVLRAKAKIIPGFQLRYIYFIDKTAKDRLTVPILPFSDIDKMGASMYKGQRIARAGSETVTRQVIQPEEGGSIPTPALIEADHAQH